MLIVCTLAAQVTSTSDAKQQETDRNMNKMNKILKSHKHVSLAKLINNPRSFAQTVENMFTLSFLVRDGRASLIFGEDGSIEVGMLLPHSFLTTFSAISEFQ